MRRNGVTGWEKLDGRGLGLSKMHTKGRKQKTKSVTPIVKKAGRAGVKVTGFMIENTAVSMLDLLKLPLLIINALIAVLTVVQDYKELRDESTRD